MRRSSGVDAKPHHSCTRLASTGRRPCVLMPDEPIGRVRGEPDGGRDRHDGLARPCAGEVPRRRLRARGHRQTVFFVSCNYLKWQMEAAPWRGRPRARAGGPRPREPRWCGARFRHQPSGASISVFYYNGHSFFQNCRALKQVAPLTAERSHLLRPFRFPSRLLRNARRFTYWQQSGWQLDLPRPQPWPAPSPRPR